MVETGGCSGLIEDYLYISMTLKQSDVGLARHAIRSLLPTGRIRSIDDHTITGLAIAYRSKIEPCQVSVCSGNVQVGLFDLATVEIINDIDLGVDVRTCSLLLIQYIYSTWRLHIYAL